VLAIETSCDETAAAVLRWHAGRADILSDIVWSQHAAHAPFKGVVPEIAARAHVEKTDLAVAAAMETAGLSFDQLDAVAGTAGPGLIGGVMVGLNAAKAIAVACGAPFLAVNHLEGHALSPRLTAEIPFPYLLLLASGGHCQFLQVEGLGAYRRLGSTIDDAAGEAFDKAARVLGLGFPGGPEVEACARAGNPTRFALPRPLLDRPGCDLSFAGLKTAVARQAEALRPISPRDRDDLAASFQAAVIDILTRRSRRAIEMARETAKVTSFVAAGGVAANAPLRAALAAEAAAAGLAFNAPPLRYCTDNAVMIALVGAERLNAGFNDPLSTPARARWPLDEIAARAQPTHRPGRKGAKA
jgi:N6-L-threonylcarbamoyladenine synthase